MDLKQMGTVYNLNKRLEEAEARLATTAFRLTELMNRRWRCRNEAARLRFIDRYQDDLGDIFTEIINIKAKMEAAKA